MFLYLAPWEWVTEGGQSFWRMPRADIGLGLIDLRSLPQCGSPGPTAQGYGLFAYSADPGNIGYSLGDFGSLVTAPRKRALKTALGLGEDIIADTPLSILLELLNRHADPTGQTRWKPLRGSLRRGVALYFAGQSWGWKLDAVVLANTVAVFQADYRRNKTDGVALASLRKWTGSTMLKLWDRMEDDLTAQLLSPEYVGDGWQSPTTTITESFNKADSDILGPDLTWTEVIGDWDVVSNQAKCITATRGTPARADSPLSSDDHYAQIVLVDLTGVYGSLIRKDNTATETFYTARIITYANSWRTYKVVTGTETNIGTNTSQAESAGDVLKVDADGSLITRYRNGSAQNSVTDTAISGNLYAGIGATNAGIILDDFEAGDLAAAARRMAVIG